jgi:hypothetical protein
MTEGEVVSGRVKRIGFQLVEYPAQVLLDSVNRVIEVAPAEAKTRATQRARSSQKEVVSKDLVMGCVESTAADQGKIGNVFFLLS